MPRRRRKRVAVCWAQTPDATCAVEQPDETNSYPMKIAGVLVSLCIVSIASCDRVRFPGLESEEAFKAEEAVIFETGPNAASSLSVLNAESCGPDLAAEATATLAERISSRLGNDGVDGGTPAGRLRRTALDDLPGIVKLEPETDIGRGRVSKGHCSATRIAPHWFVTAAHCVKGDYDRLILRAGGARLSAPETRDVLVDFAVCHSGYGFLENRYANDIALMRISEKTVMEVTDIPQAVWGRVTDVFGPDTYPEATVGGWGLTQYGGDLSDDLQKTTLYISRVGPAQISLASSAGRGPCIGDSGGPLFVRDGENGLVLMGVLSTVAENRTGGLCAGEYQSVYTNLVGFSDWLTDVMATCDATPGICRPS